MYMDLLIHVRYQISPMLTSLSHKNHTKIPLQLAWMMPETVIDKDIFSSLKYIFWTNLSIVILLNVKHIYILDVDKGKSHINIIY